ncbi:GH12 family glycosyl hydrolase domain-containing protein [Paenibacillus mucilaginosus]|uniref:GH12 family glycosyl hydrolase domain-containing protein n=1 Tax=Paenibacillus mucilaginosus TaxID=61624 RepID=UPI003D212C41
MMKRVQRIGKKIGALSAVLMLASVLAVSAATAASTSADGGKVYFDNNKQYLFNNAWGKSSVSGWSQSVYYNNASDLGWVWNWPTTSGGVKGYPSIVSGWHWTDGYTAGSGFPTRIWDNKNINTSVTYNFASNTSGVYNMTYDLWLHDTNNAKYNSRPTDEIMVWLNNTNAGALGTYIETVSIGGSSWNVYKGYVDDGTGGGWNVFSYLRTANTNSIDLNLKNFVDHAVYTKKWIANSKYISSVEFGTEVSSGSGQVNLSRWSLSVQ